MRSLWSSEIFGLAETRLLIPLVTQQNRAQGAVYFYPAVILDESSLPEPIHKHINSTAGGTNHICQITLTHFGKWFAFLIQLG